MSRTTITVSTDSGDKVIRVLDMEGEPTWMRLSEEWFSMILGLGYHYSCYPTELANVAYDFHTDGMQAQKEVKEPEAPKYPYTGVLWQGDKFVVVEFVAPDTGTVIASNERKVGTFNTIWKEEEFKKVIL